MPRWKRSQFGAHQDGIHGLFEVGFGMAAGAVEFGIGAQPGAFEGGDVALQSGEEFGGGRSGEEGAVETGLDGLEAAFLPIGAEHGFDVEEFGGGTGTELAAVAGGEGLAGGGVFAGNDGGGGIDAVLQGVEAGGGLAFGGAGSGGLLRVSAIGGELSGGCHALDVAHERRNISGGEAVSGWEETEK